MKELLNQINLTPLLEYLPKELHSDFLGEAGREHYRFLNHICKDKNLVYDIGTYRGSSSIAMSSAKEVRSFDIENFCIVEKKDNITYSLDEYLNEDILKADIILIDTAHVGDDEKDMLDYLDSINYKGLVIMDDINAFEGMTKLWETVTRRKELINYGHYTGTGLIYFE